MLTWNQFNAIPNGTRVFNHGWDQCVALANLYHEDVIGGSFVGVASAYQWWTDFGSWQTLTQKYTPSQSPVAGAIFVARGGIYNNLDGHIGIVTRVHANGTFDTMEQNAGTWRYVGRYTRDRSNVLGFLVPKNNPAGSSGAAQSESNSVARRRRKEETMLVFLNPARQDGSAAYAVFTPGVKGSWEELDNSDMRGMAANALSNQFGTPLQVTLKRWTAWQKKYK